MDYLRDPRAIENLALQQVRAEADLSALNQDQAEVAVRLAWSMAEPGLASQVRFSPGALEAGQRALRRRAVVLCDSEMVHHGLTLGSAPVHCFIKDPGVISLARSRGETRAMTAVQKWIPYLSGAMVVIGNAPTALFRLLELLEGGGPQPVLIIGMPVGLVGAAQAKQLLMEYSRRGGPPAITLPGPRGGSAAAVAVYNALVRMMPRPRQ